MSYLERRTVKFIRTALSLERSDATKFGRRRTCGGRRSLAKDVPPRTATTPEPEHLVEHTPAVSKPGGEPETGSNTAEKVADEVSLLQGDLTVGAPNPSKSSSTENELLGRAIDMIRSALERGSE
jgi:hypothetical protein